jgi:hypothetical protein
MTKTIPGDGIAQNQRTGAIAAPWLELAGVAIVSTLSLIALMMWLDNVHLSTTNGLMRSVDVEQWNRDPDTAALQHSNYLYFPLISTLCRIFDALAIQTGQAWRQMATINTIFGGIATAIIYWMVRRLTGRRDVAAIAALFHLGSAFFLSLAVMNEDIMPSYTFVLMAMAMAAVWFSAPTAVQVACVAVAFTLGWLIEWRVMFPTLPPLLLALALSRGTTVHRAGRIILFLAASAGVVLLVLWLSSGHVGAASRLRDLVWTGKGLNQAWAGFSMLKVALVPVGMGEYLLGGHNNPDFAGSDWAAAFVVEIALLVGFLILIWRDRDDARLRTVSIIFLGTLVAGEIVNAYSQPQDPQMQINVMPWLTVAFALVLAKLSISRTLPMVAAAVLVTLPLAFNVHAFGVMRGSDGRALAALDELERLSDPARTVYVYPDFDGALTWHFARWASRSPGVCDLGPSPRATPKFKWISMTLPIVDNPGWSPQEYVARIKGEIDCALDQGYRVIANPTWMHFDAQIDGTLTLLHAREHGLALLPILQSYRARPIGGPRFDSQYPGGYFEITRP